MCGSRHTFSRTETKYFVGATEIPANQLREIPGYRFAELFPHRREGFTLKYGVKPVQIPDRDRIPVAQQKEDHLATLGHWKHRRVERGEMTEAQYAAEMAAAEKNWFPSSAFAYLVTNATPPQAIDRVIKWERKEKQTMCGAKCRNARGPNCDCICEGKYHGAGMTNSRTRFAASDLDFKPTAEMAANATRGLELREKHGKGGTAVGVARARDIKNRANLSPDTVKRMHSFFSRHEGNQAGGDAGKAWAARKAAQIDKSESARGAARKATMANQANDSFTVQLRWNGMGAPQHRVAFKTLAEAEKEAERLHRLYGSLGNPEFPTMKGIVEIEVHDTKQPWKTRTVRWFASRPGAKARFASIDAGMMDGAGNEVVIRMADGSRATARYNRKTGTWSLEGHADVPAFAKVRELVAHLTKQGMSRPGAKARFEQLQVGDAFRFEGKIYVVNSNAEEVNALLASDKRDSEKALMLAGYLYKRWLSYEGKANAARFGKSAFSLEAVKSAAAKVAAAYGTGEDSAVIRKHLDRIVSVLSGNSEGGRREAMGIHAQIGSVAERTHGRDFMWSAPMQGLESAIRSAGQFARPGAKARFDRMAVANEILRQLGGGRFMAMVGGKNALATTVNGKNGLQVQIGRGAKNGINRLVVLLDEGSDTYDMQLWRIGQRGLSTTKVWEGDGLYAEDLARIFTDKTGFYTSFARPGAKARFANWETNLTKKYGKPIEEHTAKIGRNSWKIEVAEAMDGSVVANLFLWNDNRGFEHFESGSLQGLRNLAERTSRSDAAGIAKINRIANYSRPGAKSTHATDNMYYTVAAHIGDQPAGERTTKSLDEAKAHAKAMLAALKPNAKGKPLVVDVYPVVNYSPQAPVLSLKASRTSADSNRLTLAQRIAVAHDAKRMARR